jgi:thymidylate synthase (FAD)
MSNVKLISHTTGAGELEGKSPQEVISYVARVSNPHNQENYRTAAGLLKYCIKHEHWSIFETVSMTLEINTNRALLLRCCVTVPSVSRSSHRGMLTLNSLMRTFLLPDLRRQDQKNRQNSISDLPPGQVAVYRDKIARHFDDAMWLYNNLLDSGVAKESARFVLPLATPTRIYMTGTCRSWIHYIALRSSNGTQEEHRLIAEDVVRSSRVCFLK